MSNFLEGFVGKRICVVTADGRFILGTLRGFDQTINLILINSVERVFNGTEGVDHVQLGLYVVRGDNVALIGLIDEVLDESIKWADIKCSALNPTRT
ncbi:hypothetical protein GJ496_008532 [Pomphorhynchus laevis]|nr:hypothetical protein GJ496_008532 [Pomphorhynchus laevis]